MHFSRGLAEKNRTLAIFASALLLSALAGALLVDRAIANPVYQKRGYNNVSVQSPQPNQTYSPQENIALKFTAKTNMLTHEKLSYFYTLDGSGEVLYGPVWNDFLKLNKISLVSKVVISDDFSGGLGAYPPYTEWTFNCSATLPLLSEGKHNVTIYWGYDEMNEGAAYSNLLTVSFNVKTPLAVAVLSLENASYTGDVPLTFTVNKPFSKAAYSLDGQANVTISGNTTLTGLPNGSHSVTVYATDAYDSTGASKTVAFTVAEKTETEPRPESFPNGWLAAGIVASAVVICLGLLAFYARTKKKNSTG